MLAEIGIFDKVAAKAIQAPAIVLHSYRSGAILSKMELVPYVQDKYGAPYLVIHRADLRRILFEEAEARGAQVRLGVKIDIGKTSLADGVLHLANGEEIHADLVIGADGLQSTCRGALFPQLNPLRSTARIVNRTIIDTKAMESSQLNNLVLTPNIHAWLGPRSMAICYLLKGAYNVVLTRPAGDEPDFLGPRPADIEELRCFFRDWDPQLQNLVEIGHKFQKWTLLELDEPLGSWVHSDGKFILIGDAAHPSLPYLAQGAAIGFESALVLAILLSKATHSTQIPKLLQQYYILCQPRAAQVVQASKKMGDIWSMPDGALQTERDRQFLTEIPPSIGYPNPLEDPFFQNWLWGFDVKKAAEEVSAMYPI
ncbi:hypothetical protein MMC22_003125 [Lobaria immixta]|nr:hypothetical protein [Lobaria immixta]